MTDNTTVDELKSEIEDLKKQLSNITNLLEEKKQNDTEEEYVEKIFEAAERCYNEVHSGIFGEYFVYTIQEIVRDVEQRCEFPDGTPNNRNPTKEAFKRHNDVDSAIHYHLAEPFEDDYYFDQDPEEVNNEDTLFLYYIFSFSFEDLDDENIPEKTDAEIAFMNRIREITVNLVVERDVIDELNVGIGEHILEDLRKKQKATAIKNARKDWAKSQANAERTFREGGHAGFGNPNVSAGYLSAFTGLCSFERYLKQKGLN